MKPTLFPPEEAPGEGDHRLPALSVIMKSGGSVEEIVKTKSGGLPFKRPRVCVIQTGQERKKFKMAPVTFYNHLIS